MGTCVVTARIPRAVVYQGNVDVADAKNNLADDDDDTVNIPVCFHSL